MKRTQGPHGTLFMPDSQSLCTDAVITGTDFAHPPSKEDWARVQSFIHHLYVVQKQPLKHIEKALKDRNFRATQRMIKQRCKGWGYQKNAKHSDWGILAILDDRRRRAGKAATVFEIHGQKRTLKDLHRFIRNQNQTPEQFLAKHLDEDHIMPDYIRVLTPELEDTKDSPLPATDSPSDSSLISPAATSTVQLLPSYSPDLGYQTSFNTVTSSCHRDQSREPGSPARSRAGSTKIFQQQTPPVSPPSHEGACQHPQTELLQMSGQMLHRCPQASRVLEQDMRAWTLITPRSPSAAGRDPLDEVEYRCSRCHQPSQEHAPPLDNLETRKQYRGSLLQDSTDEHFHLPVSRAGEGAWIWVSRAFLACMYFSRGDQRFGQTALDDAAHNFELALRRNDPLLLTAAHLTITILHTHDQDQIASRILNSTKEVVDCKLEKTDPIRTTIEYFTYSANGALQENGFSSATMKGVYNQFRNRYGESHPYTITSLHNYGWILRYEDHLDEAEVCLKTAHKASLAYFDRLHMQTVTCQAVLAGVLRPLPQRRSECIAMYRAVVPDAAEILGPIHPYVLRLKLELANILKATQLGQHRAEVVDLYRQVLWGRAQMLGRNHSFTGGVRETYEATLKEFELWTTDEGKPSPQRLMVEELFSFDHDAQEAWQEVEAGADVEMSEQSENIKIEYVGDGTTRRVWMRSRSHTRTPSPTTSNDFSAY